MTAPVFPYLLGFHPNHLEPSFTHCSTPAPKIEPGKPIKVLNWNIQFLAGAYYPYWHHTFNQPLLTEEDLQKNLEGIVNVIREEKPDIIQLQEVHRTHPLTFHQDQLKMLHDKLSDILPCYGTGTYWKAHFIPSRHLTGQVEMSLVTMSRFRIDRAVTEVLPTTRRKRILVPFYPRHSLLETRFPLAGGGFFTTINTHLDSPSTGRGNMNGQIHTLLNRVTKWTEKHRLWMLSGDFNLLPPGFYETLPENQKHHYSPYSPLTPFYQNFKGIPELKDVFGPNSQKWLTAYDMNPELDLVIDYIFHPRSIHSEQNRVRHIPLNLSDHMPVITTLQLKPGT